MKRRWVMFAVAGLICLSSAVTDAQYGAYRNYAGYNNWGYGYGAGYATTPYQSYANGMSSMMRSQAIANQINAQAALTAQEARRSAMDTQVKGTQTFFELRRMNEEYRAQEAARKKPANTLGTSNEQYARSAQPRRLPANLLDPVTGKIAWTPILDSNEFATYRQQLDALFVRRAQDGSAVSVTEIQQFTGPMRASIDKGLENGSIAQLDWLSAKKLLEGLELEGRYPSG